MATVISGLEIYAPVFKVNLGELNEKLLRDSITSVDVDEDLDEPARFTISLNDTLNMKTQKFKWLDDINIAPGTEVSIYFGYAQSPQKQSSITGKIKAITPGFISTGTQMLSIEGYDLSHDLQKTEGDLSYSKATYSNVAEKIASSNHLSTSGIEDSEKIYEKIERKKNEKDYAMLKRLAGEIGFEFFVRDRTLFFRKPKDDKDGEISFEFRKNFISFNPRMATATLVNEVNVTAWNEKDKESISATAGISDIKSSVGIPNFDSVIEKSNGKKITVKLEGRVVRSKDEAKALAIAELKRRNNGFIQGQLECAGDPMLRPGITVNIDKIGERFSGVYYITKAKHSIGDGGYKTTLDVRRSI